MSAVVTKSCQDRIGYSVTQDFRNITLCFCRAPNHTASCSASAGRRDVEWPGAKSQAVSYLGGSSDKTAQRFVKQKPGNCNLTGILEEHRVRSPSTA